MGISSAMTPKDRKLILAGLLDQGVTEVGHRKRGTLLKTAAGDLWMLPHGTSDTKARLAMRAEVRRLGLRWPLDGESPKKKEPMTTETIERPLLEHKAIPATLKDGRTLVREEAYRSLEPILRGWEDRTFWTQDILDDIRTRTGGYRSSAAMQRMHQMLDFAGFRVVESKQNRNGHSYRWARDEREPWPKVFAPTVTGAAAQKMAATAARGGRVTATCVDCGRVFEVDKIEAHQRTAKHGPFAADSADAPVVETPVERTPTPVDLEEKRAKRHTILTAEEAAKELGVAVTPALREAVASTNLDGETFAFGEDVEVVPQGNTEEDAALSLAEEAEREATAAKARATTLLRRVAELEGMVNQRDVMIARVTSERDEAKALLGELDAQIAVTSDIAEHVDALRIEREATARLTAERDAAQNEVLRLKLAARTTPVLNEGWWTLEGGKQTIDQIIEGARNFGLEVRVEARRKDA